MVCYDSKDSIVIRRDATVVVGVRPVGYPPSLPVEGAGEAGLSVLPRVDTIDEAPGEALLGTGIFCKTRNMGVIGALG